MTAIAVCTVKSDGERLKRLQAKGTKGPPAFSTKGNPGETDNRPIRGQKKTVTPGQGGWG